MRLIDSFSQQTIRLNGKEYIGCFYAHFELIKAGDDRGDDRHGAWLIPQQRRLTVFFLQIFPAIRHLRRYEARSRFAARAVHHHTHVLRYRYCRAMRAAVNAVFRYFQRKCGSRSEYRQPAGR